MIGPMYNQLPTSSFQRNLAAELAVPLPPNTSYTEDVIDIPEPCDLDGLPLDERCQQQSRLLSVYEEKIHHFRDQVLLNIQRPGTV